MKKIRVLGLMSGTSMDGLDCGLFEIYLSNQYEFVWKCIDFCVFPYSDRVRNLINESLLGDNNKIFQIDRLLGDLFAKCTQKFLNGNKIDLIGSHGQTISHYDGVSSKQIGDPNFMYEKFSVPIIYNFRQADINNGGSGAPLMPFLDWLLFRSSKKNTITINLGGIANISFVDTKGDRDKVMGFDTGPGMALIDELCKIRWGVPIDKDGRFSSKGKVCNNLLNELMNNKYINKIPPKSTGRDEFGLNIVDYVLSQYPHLSYKDIVRTFCKFTAQSIFVNVEKFIKKRGFIDRVIISGGGAKHPVLMNDLRELLQIKNIRESDSYGIESKLKESLLISVLAIAKINNLASNMPSVTNSNKLAVLGDVYK